jgi:hypothetical protein
MRGVGDLVDEGGNLVRYKLSSSGPPAGLAALVEVDPLTL